MIFKHLHIKKLLGVILLSAVCFSVNAQFIKKDTTDITFTGGTNEPYDSIGKLKFSGYVDTYYALYADKPSKNGFAKFPTASPRNNQIGLNIAQFSVKYTTNRVRAVASVFFGDVPKAVWSPKFNFIQEAHAGVRLVKKLWLDVGFFRTHFGLESIQPRENITTSFALTSYFGPYYMSGAKLTWQQSKKWSFQVNVFNGFSTFVETNKNKAFGFSIAYSPNKHWSHTLNSIVCDEYPSHSPQHHLRSYTNYVATYKSQHFLAGLGANFGFQQNSNLKDSTKMAFMFSSTLSLKYRITKMWAIYGREEVFLDPNEMLTGPIKNDDNKLVGLAVLGGTFGAEFKPISNAFIRLETRCLHTKQNQQIFTYNGYNLNYRWEGMLTIGVWF